MPKAHKYEKERRSLKGMGDGGGNTGLVYTDLQEKRCLFKSLFLRQKVRVNLNQGLF